MSLRRLGIYHRVDNDGFACAAILRHRFPSIDLFGMNYGDEEPHFIEDYDQVYIADFSLPPKRMQHLNSLTELHWIDHHQTAINDCKDLDLLGVRKIGEGACSLLWQYLYPHYPVPEAIQLISDYDVWNLSDMVIHFQYGLRLMGDIRLADGVPEFEGTATKEWLDYQNLSYFWENLLRGSQSLVDSLKDEGSVVYRYVRSQLAKAIKRGVVTSFHGHDALFVMTPDNPSLMAELWKDYDICIKAFYDLSALKWRHTLFSHPGGPNVGKIAKKHGGGGHEHCAGFMSDCLVIFNKLLE